MQIILDKDGYFTGNYATIGSLVPTKDTQIIEITKEDEEKVPINEDYVKQTAYKYENGAFVLDEDRYAKNKAQQEAEQKQAEEEAKLNKTNAQLNADIQYLAMMQGIDL